MRFSTAAALNFLSPDAPASPTEPADLSPTVLRAPLSASNSAAAASFRQIASTARDGTLLADIALTWDGVLWAIDGGGEPYIYDPGLDQWNAFGQGISAAAAVGDLLWVFRGNEYLEIDLATNTVTTGPRPVATLWPWLPDTFKLTLSGASNERGIVYLVSGGLYTPAEPQAHVLRLCDLDSWPTSVPWIDGIIDAVVQTSEGTTQFMRGNEYVTVSLTDRMVLSGPASVSQILPPYLVTSGIDAGFGIASVGEMIYFAGQSVFVFSPGNGELSGNYVPFQYQNWPASWNPNLIQAPLGRTGNLWSVTVPGQIVVHNGERWTTVGTGLGTSISCGSDGTVAALMNASNSIWLWNGTEFVSSGSAPGSITYVSVADRDHIWVLASSIVYSYDIDQQVFTPNPQIANATRIAGNFDGSLWHVSGQSASVTRSIVASDNGSQELALPANAVAYAVTSAGFGSAYVMAQSSGSDVYAYAYDSPYVMKSDLVGFASNSLYIVPGLSNLYVSTTALGTTSLTSSVAAVDAHTGRQVSAAAPLIDNTYSTPTFDPIHELIYVGLTIGTSGKLLALDARDLTVVRWEIQTPGSLSSGVTLDGTKLLFADGSSTLYCLDTKAALQAAVAGTTPTLLWQRPIQTEKGKCVPSLPLLSHGRIYSVLWVNIAGGDSAAERYDCYLDQCDAKDGGTSLTRLLHSTSVDMTLPRPAAPAMVRSALPDASIGNMLVVNAGDQVIGVAVSRPGLPDTTFDLLSGYVYGGFAYDDGTRVGTPLQPAGTTPAQPTLWFGDTFGNLYGLSLLESIGNSWKQVSNTPFSNSAGPNGQSTIYTTPVVFKDQQGGMTILYGAYNGLNTSGNLLLFNPVSGVQGSVNTGVTQPCCLTPGVINGTVYAGGVFTPDGAATRGTAQIYGVRVDPLVQALNFFIIESQMMQDPDPKAPGGDPKNTLNPIPPSRARYQTHVTLVDAQKIPRPGQHVKIWADKPATIHIAGQPSASSIGPDDTQYASAQTGLDGSFVINSGYCATDASDLPNVYAPVLRLWASFMDTWERIVITPDHEFHRRVATAHATATDTDPDKVNLVTTVSYAATKAHTQPVQLFTSQEQTSGQPKNCADAVAQMRTGTGFGSGNANNSTSTLFLRRGLHLQGTRRARRLLRDGNFAPVSSPGKYIAYADTTGIGYFPTNIPAIRDCVVAQPVGLMFTKPKGAAPTEATLQLVDHAVAAIAFNNLPPASTTPPWSTRNASITGMQVSNIFTDFWDWLVRAFEALVAEITDIIVTIADEVMVAIRMIVNGVEQVFKAIVHVVDDIASAIGSFFVMLEKSIEDVIAALSVLFHFGEIMWTHRWLANQINGRMQDVSNAIEGQVMPSVQKFFNGGKAEITKAFASARQSLEGQGSQPLNHAPGSNQSVHTAFTLGASGSPKTSHAASCAWGLQKMKSGLPGASPRSTGASIRATDPLRDFLTNFAHSLTSDPNLSAAFAHLQADFDSLFHVESVSQFFSTLVITILDMVETLLLTAIDIAQGFVEGILGLVADVVTIMTESVFGYGIDIPVLTWLYETLFDEELTLLNLATLVAAIPVTIVFRVVEGRYPSQANLPALGSRIAEFPQTASATVQTVLGCFTGVFQLVLGVSNCCSDGAGEESLPLFGYLSLAAGGLIQCLTFPLIANANPTSADWAVYGVALVGAWGGLAGVPLDQAEPALGSTEMSFNTCILSIAAFGAAIADYVEDQQTDGIANAVFAEEIIQSIVGVMNPIKLLGGEAAGVVALADCLGGIVELFMTLIIAVEGNAAASGPGALSGDRRILIGPGAIGLSPA